MEFLCELAWLCDVYERGFIYVLTALIFMAPSWRCGQRYLAFLTPSLTRTKWRIRVGRRFDSRHGPFQNLMISNLTQVWSSKRLRPWLGNHSTSKDATLSNLAYQRDAVQTPSKLRGVRKHLQLHPHLSSGEIVGKESFPYIPLISLIQRRR